jgi:hypothetical protein
MGFPKWDIKDIRELSGVLGSPDMVRTVTASWLGAEPCHR